MPRVSGVDISGFADLRQVEGTGRVSFPGDTATTMHQTRHRVEAQSTSKQSWTHLLKACEPKTSSEVVGKYAAVESSSCAYVHVFMHVQAVIV